VNVPGIVLGTALMVASGVGMPTTGRRSLRPGAAADSTRVSDYLSYDQTKRVAWVTLRAGEDGDNGGMSFNGTHGGAEGFIIPVGWRVEVMLRNDDGALPHSVMVIPNTAVMPEAMTHPALPGASSADAQDGTMVGDSARFAFRTSQAGSYLLACAVPGHGAAGMYLRLDVMDSARLPRSR
jgi:sulfocyanin